MAKKKVRCQAFLLCRNEATTVLPFKVLGHDVPCCQRCKEKLARIEAATRQRGGE